MKEYTVTFSIEVSAPTRERAAARAWELLSGPDASLPVAEVKRFGKVECSAQQTLFDLQEMPEILSPQYRRWLHSRR